MDEAEDGMPGAAGVSASANAAKRMVQAVQQFVAMLQIHLVRAPGTLPALQLRVLAGVTNGQLSCMRLPGAVS